MAKTSKGLIEYAKAQLGLPYWYGTFGNTGSESLWVSKRKQYPQYYNWSGTKYDNFPSQYGKRVHDCVGLIKGYLWSETPTSTPKYNVSQDVSANGMRKACKEKGDIGTMPDIPGVLVFMNGHIGVYIGNGEVIEARGHEYGVVKTKLAGRGWKWWGKCPFITYDTTSKTDIKLKLNAGSWNVRAGADTTYKVITVVKNNITLIADKKDAKTGWYYIPSLNGWISNKAVTEIK